MSTQHFNATGELESLRQKKRERRQRAFYHSRLMRFRAELVALRQAGASYRELALWLRQQRVKVTHTTVMRYLSLLPELQEVFHDELS